MTVETTTTAKTQTTSGQMPQHSEEEFAQALKLMGAEDDEQEPDDDAQDGQQQAQSGEDDGDDADEDDSANQELNDAEAKSKAKIEGKKETTEIEIDTEQYDKVLQQRRMLWQQQKRMQAERSELEKLKQEIQELKNGQQGKSKKAYESPIEEALDDEQEEWLPPSKLKEKIRNELKKELMEEFSKKEQEEMTKAEAQAQLDMYKSNISELVMANEEKYPMAHMFLDDEEIQERAFAIVEQDYRRKADAYGHEYAAENTMTEQQAADALEKSLAKKYAPRLQSEKNQKLLRQHLGKQQESKRDGIQTLGSDVRNSTTSDDGPQDWDERIKWASRKFVKTED